MPDTYLLTDKDAVFSSPIAYFMLIFSVIGGLTQFVRLRATIIGDARSARLANLTVIASSTIVLVGLLAALAAFFGFVAHVWRQGRVDTLSYVASAAIGVAIVVSAFVAVHLTRERKWRFTADDDDTPLGYMWKALVICMGLPIAALFGFALAFIALLLLERAAVNVEPIRAFFNAHTPLFIVLTTVLFLGTSAIVHAGLRTLRPRNSPVFLATMLGTGCAINIATVIILKLVGLKGQIR